MFSLAQLSLQPYPSLVRAISSLRVLLLLAGLQCQLDSEAQEIENQPPSVGGALILGGDASGSRITLMAFPSDSDGSISRVEYFQGSRYLGAVFAPPYNLTARLLNTAPHVFHFTMVAVDNLDARSAPALASITKSSGTIPDDLPVKQGLQLWLRADAGVTTGLDGGVIAWQDQSEHGNHAGPLGAAYQPTGTEAPLWINDDFAGAPRIRFDGDDDVLEIGNAPSLQPGTNDWTVLFVMQSLMESTEVFAPVIGSRQGNSIVDEGWEIAFGGPDRLASHFADGHNGHDFQQALSSSPVLDGALQLWHVEENRTAQTTRFFFGGNPDGVLTAAMATEAVNPSEPIHVGRALGGVVDRRAAIDLAEIIVFNRILSIAERESVTTYLAGKYEVAALVITNRPPTVSLSTPPSGKIFSFREPVTLSAAAADSDGSITKVEFLENGRSLGIATRTPFRLAITNLPPGECSLTARATDNQGLVTTSVPVVVKIVVPLLLQVGTEDDELKLTWDGPGVLETAERLDEAWIPVLDSVSPYLVPTSNGQRLFRLRQPNAFDDSAISDRDDR